MFDMTETGKRLAQSRRNANLTQMEVAEHLGISFQAVSYWERGKTLPDIANLVKIAELYNISIDDILNNKRQANAIDHITKHKPTPYLLDILSIMKPNDITEAIQNATLCVERFDQIIESAPYLEEDILDKLVLQHSEKVESFAQIKEIAWQMGKDALSDLIEDHLSLPERFSYICDLASFINKSTLCKLARQNVEKVEAFSQICNLSSFLDQKTLDALVIANPHKAEGFAQVSFLAYYLSPHALEILTLANIGKPITEKESANICYYLGEERAAKLKDRI